MYGDVDEDGEPTYDPDEQWGEGSPGPDADPEAELLEPEEEEWQDSPSGSPSASPLREVLERPTKAKPRKRLVKKTAAEDDVRELDPLEEEDRSLSKRKSRDSEEGEGRKRVRKIKEGKESRDRDRDRDRDRERDGGSSKKGKSSSSTAAKLSKLARSGEKGSKSDRLAGSDRPSRSRDRREEKAAWEEPAPAEDSEEDKEAEPTADDDNFIDDTGVERYSDDEGGYVAGSPSHAPEAEEAEEGEGNEEEDELGKFFKSNRKKVAKEHTSEEKAMFVEQFMAKLDVAAEADADLNRNSKPAIQKLKMLPELLNVLEKRQLQQEFLDRGVLSSLKNWLEPLPDGSLPNMNIRSALLKLLTDLPIDVEVFERREQLKKSGLGKVVMFLSRLSEETPVNKKLARDLVDKWSRPIFQKSTRYEDLRQYDDERPLPRRTPVKKPAPKPAVDESRGGDELEQENDSEEPKAGEAGYRHHASRPQALPLDFVIRPESKFDADSVREQTKQQRMDDRRYKMNKKLQQLRTPKKRNLQASRVSVEGRGLVKFF